MANTTSAHVPLEATRCALKPRPTSGLAGWKAKSLSAEEETDLIYDALGRDCPNSFSEIAPLTTVHRNSRFMAYYIKR